MEIRKTKEMEKYEAEIGKYAIWRGVITESFKKWLNGEKCYDRDKERIALYVTGETKAKWKNFVKYTKLTSISMVIREAVNNYIDKKLKIIYPLMKGSEK